MDKHQLTTHSRKITGRKVKSLRREGLTPASVYGKKTASLNIQINTKEFLNLFSQVGESTLIYLKNDSDKDLRPVFISDVVKHPVSGQALHVTFHQVDLKEKVTAPVPVRLIGEAPAEKEKLGIMVQQLDELEIEALPTDMPENIQVEVSGLSEVGSNIKISNLKLDSKLHIVTDPGSIIVQIEALAKEEVVAPPVTPEAAAVPEAEAAVPEGEAPPVKTQPETKDDKK
jgi:large subunit ribosomal protein L25